MTDHLPECRYVVFQQQGQIPEAVIPMGCICDALRACEQRVLDAARDAVASVPLVMAFTGDLALIRQPVALAAIDALRGES